jgi:carboxyl-terminal processing protease
MVKALPTALPPILLCCLVLAPRGHASEPARRTKEAAGGAFAGEVLTVVQGIHEAYFIEIPQERLIEWAVRGLYRRLLKDVPADIDESLRKAGRMKDKELRGLLLAVRQDAGKDRDVSGDRLLDLALEEMTGPLDDPPRVIYPSRFHGHRQWPAVGVGLKLRSDPSSGMPQVVTPALGGPAYRAGIRAGDLIAQITLPEGPGDEPLKESTVIPTKGLSLAAVLQHLTGKEGTRVRLKVQRPGAERPTECVLMRAPVGEETVLGYRRKNDDRWDYWADAGKKVAYIRLARIREGTAGDLEKVLNTLWKENMQGLILDLRFSPGGLVPSAFKICDLFIADGVIASIRSRGQVQETERATGKGRYLDFPIACLVNRETADTSEVIAACLQDHRRAVILGERSKGHTGIEVLCPCGDDKVLRITTHLFYRPSGKKLHRARVPGSEDDDWGVTPEPRFLLRLRPAERQQLADYLEGKTLIRPRRRSGQEDRAAFKDRQLDTAVAYLRCQAAKP